MKRMTIKSSVSFAETFDDFLLSRKAKDLTEKTLTTYKQHFSSIAKHIRTDKPIEEVNKEDLKEMISAMRDAGLSANSIKSYQRKRSPLSASDHSHDNSHSVSRSLSSPPRGRGRKTHDQKVNSQRQAHRHLRRFELRCARYEPPQCPGHCGALRHPQYARLSALRPATDEVADSGSAGRSEMRLRPRRAQPRGG